MLKKIILICGILSSLLYIGGDVVAALFWDRYSITSHSVSELMATGLTVLLIIFSIGFGANGIGKKPFCIYSVLTIVLLLFFGIWAEVDAPDVAADMATPWLGIKERVNIYGFMIWVIVFSIMLVILPIHLNKHQIKNI